MKLFFDESGTTGSDLNNRGTPVFTLASNNLMRIEATSIIREIFGNRIEELKYAAIKEKDNDLVLNLIDRLASQKEKFACYVMHKPYTLVVQLVRFWYVHWLESKGLKLDPSFGVVFANQCYAELRGAGPDTEFWSIMQLFQEMMGQYNIENYNKFWDALADYHRRHPETSSINSLLKAWYDWDATQYYKSLFHDSRRHVLLQIHMSALIALVAYWSERHPRARFALVHDGTSELKKLKKTFAGYCKPKKRKSWSGYSFNVNFPLPVDANSSSFDADSREHPQIELSDMLAGATADYFGAYFEPNGELTSYHNELWHAGLGQLLAGAVAPNYKEALNEFTRRHQR